jgi:hypothetical protein
MMINGLGPNELQSCSTPVHGESKNDYTHAVISLLAIVNLLRLHDQYSVIDPTVCQGVQDALSVNYHWRISHQKRVVLEVLHNVYTRHKRLANFQVIPHFTSKLSSIIALQ